MVEVVRMGQFGPECQNTHDRGAQSRPIFLQFDKPVRKLSNDVKLNRSVMKTWMSHGMV
jgi:hypothetical protein